MVEGIQVTAGCADIKDLDVWKIHLTAKGIKSFIVRYKHKFELWRDLLPQDYVTDSYKGVGRMKPMVVPNGARILHETTHVEFQNR